MFHGVILPLMQFRLGSLTAVDVCTLTPFSLCQKEMAISSSSSPSTSSSVAFCIHSPPLPPLLSVAAEANICCRNPVLLLLAAPVQCTTVTLVCLEHRLGCLASVVVVSHEKCAHAQLKSTSIRLRERPSGGRRWL